MHSGAAVETTLCNSSHSDINKVIKLAYNAFCYQSTLCFLCNFFSRVNQVNWVPGADVKQWAEPAESSSFNHRPKIPVLHVSCIV